MLFVSALMIPVFTSFGLTEEIIELAKDALQNKDKIAEELEERTKILGERSLFTIEYAARLLENKGR